jgi:hypothetical protein
MMKTTLVFLFAGLSAGCSVNETQTETFGGGSTVNIANKCAIRGQESDQNGAMREYKIEAVFSRGQTYETLDLIIQNTLDSVDKNVVFTSQLLSAKDSNVPTGDFSSEKLALYDMGFGDKTNPIYPTVLDLPGQDKDVAKLLSNPLLSVNFSDLTATLFLREPTMSSNPDYQEVVFACDSINSNAVNTIDALLDVL